MEEIIDRARSKPIVNQSSKQTSPTSPRAPLPAIFRSSFDPASLLLELYLEPPALGAFSVYYEHREPAASAAAPVHRHIIDRFVPSTRSGQEAACLNSRIFVRATKINAKNTTASNTY